MCAIVGVDRLEANRRSPFDAPTERTLYITSPPCLPSHRKVQGIYRANAATASSAAPKIEVLVPTELVVYPGEPHGLTKLSHRKAKMEWDLAWFDKYVTANSK